MRRVKQGAATRMHSGRLDPVGLTINFKMTPSRFNHFQLKMAKTVLLSGSFSMHLFVQADIDVATRHS